MTPQQALLQRHEALTRANARRSDLATAKRALRDGTLTLHDAMMNPPQALKTVLLIDVIRQIRTQKVRSGAAVQLLGRMAVRDDVNLLVPVGKASPRSREWVARHGELWMHKKAERR